MEFGLSAIVISIISFVSLFLSFFWISAFYFEEPNFHKRTKMPKALPRVSIIVPAYNEELTIGDTLKSLLKLDYPRSKFEIIVVANGCTDKTAGITRKFPSIRLIETETAGKARAQNLGIAEAKGEIIIVADADILVKRDSLRKLVPYFENKEVAEVVPAVKVLKPKNLLEKVQHYEYVVSAFVKQLLSGLDTLFIVPGAFNAYRKSALKEVGGFDEQTLTEDIEMGTRLLRNGYKVLSNIDAHVRVRAPRTLRAFHSQRMRWNRGFIETVSKHRAILFNKNYGLLGLLLPLTIVIPTLLAAVLSAGIAKLASLVTNFAFLLSFADLQLILYALVPKGVLHLNTLLVVPAATVIATGLYLYNKAHQHLRERWKNPFAAFVFIFLYPIWLTFYWLLAFAAHIAKAEKVWRSGSRW